MRTSLETALRRLTYSPEFNIAIFAGLLNWPWEFLQVPFFSGMAEVAHWSGIKTCTRATLGDAAMMVIAYWCVAIVAGRYWLLRPTLGKLAAFLAVGLAVTVGIEKIALAGVWIQQWSYSDRMPVVPLLNVGLTPMLQWIVLPPLVIWFSKRQLEPRASVPKA